LTLKKANKTAHTGATPDFNIILNRVNILNVQKATKLRILEFLRPLILGIGFAFKVVYYIAFAWWLDPWLRHKANRGLVDDIERNLSFLIAEPSAIRVLNAESTTAEILTGNLLFTVSRWRGDTTVSVAPRHSPVQSYEIGPLVAAFERRHFSEQDIVNDLVDAARLLRPRLDVLNAAFSEEEFSSVCGRL
jgi:hypothetical protein